MCAQEQDGGGGCGGDCGGENSNSNSKITSTPPHTGSTSTSTPTPTPVPDSHCHPTDTPTTFPQISHMRASKLTAMATNGRDQSLVAELARSFPDKVVPGFGWHPWFSHLIWDDDENGELVGLWRGDDEKGNKEGSESGEGGQEKDGWEMEFKIKHYSKVLKGPGGGANGGGEGGGAAAAESYRGFVEKLPLPRKLRGDVLVELRENLSSFMNTSSDNQGGDGGGGGVVLGEVGLDRGFRLPWPKGYNPPEAATSTTSKDRALSPYKVSMDHQLLVFTSQLKIAGELGLPASIHGVQAHGTMFDTLRGLWRGWEVRVESRRERRSREMRGRKLGGKEREWVDRFLLEDGRGLEELDSDGDAGDDDFQDDENTPEVVDTIEKQNNHKTPHPSFPPFPPRICLHSFSAPSQTLTQYLTNPSPTTAFPTKVFFSFSTTINTKNKDRLSQVLKMVPKERILVESDLRIAGEDMDKSLEEAVDVVAELREWEGEETRLLMVRNWREWVFGVERGKGREGEGEGEEGEQSP